MADRFWYYVTSTDTSKTISVAGVPIAPLATARVFLTTAEAAKAELAGFVCNIQDINQEQGTDETPVKDLRFRVKASTAATYTILDDDNNCLLDITHGTGCTVTLPKTMPVGFNIRFLQSGAGQLTFSAASGASVVSSGSLVKSKQQYAVVTAFVKANTDGVSAAWVLMDDLGT